MPEERVALRGLTSAAEPPLGLLPGSHPIELNIELLIDYNATQQTSFELFSVPGSMVSTGDTNMNKTRLLGPVIDLTIAQGDILTITTEVSIYSVSGTVSRLCTCNPHTSMR